MGSSTSARSSNPWSGAEVAGVELVGGTDLSRGRDSQMEYDRDGRRKSESKVASA
jgi:hypothetical protein